MNKRKSIASTSKTSGAYLRFWENDREIRFPIPDTDDFGEEVAALEGNPDFIAYMERVAARNAGKPGTSLEDLRRELNAERANSVKRKGKPRPSPRRIRSAHQTAARAGNSK